jgi:4-amino-4-deoxy-L-arabinose transferase-like glycosyltransferase
MKRISHNHTLGRLVPALLLLLIMLAAFGLRVWGSSFGLPAYTRYHPDEHALVDRAAAILWTGDWNLQRFNYPAFYAYIQAGAYALYFLYGVTQDLWYQVPPFTVPNYYQVGRLVTVLFGTLTVLVVYIVGREMRGKRTGLLSAAVLGGSYLHVIHSHYATFDVMVTFLISLALLFSLLLVQRREAKWYFLAGLCAGLAGATKYNGALALIIPLAAYCLSASWGEWGWLSGRLLLILGGFLLGFFGGNPFALPDLPGFLNGLATVLHHYGTQHPGFEGLGNWRWYPGVFLASADGPWIVFGLVGLALLTWRDWKKGLLLLVFPVLYYLLVARFVVRFERNMVPLLPFLALGVGWLLDVGADWLANRFRLNRTICHALAAVPAVLLLALPITASILFDVAISRTDMREEAGQWLEDNIESGSKIAIEHYSVPFDHAGFEVEDVLRITDHDFAWYQQEGYDVLVISDGVWPVLHEQPEHYAEKLDAYTELTANSELLAEFVPHPPGIVVAGYPTVAVYHFAPARVYWVPR